MTYVELIGLYAWSNKAKSLPKWLEAATDSLGTYSVTPARLPIDGILLDDGPFSVRNASAWPSGEGLAEVVRQAGASLSKASTGLLAGACKVCRWGAEARRQ